MKKTLSAVFLLSLLISSAAARAEFNFQWMTGRARFGGDISSDVATGVNDIGVRYFGTDNNDYPAMSYGLGFDVLWLDSRHNNPYFPYPDQERLHLLCFLLLPTACWNWDENLGLCASLGLGTVNVNSPRNRQDYGSWNYEVAARYRGIGGWYASLISKYVGKVEQRVDGVDSEFWFVTYGAAIGKAI